MDHKDPEHSREGYNSQHENVLQPTTTLTPELFERLYLQPKQGVSGDLRKTFANPTPLALLGFSVSLTPLSCEFMGWRDAGGNGVATVGATLWFGGALLLIAGLGDFILCNTFPFIVFMEGGLDPYSDGSQAATPGILASFAFYPLALGILSFVFLICSLRTNLVFFFLIFVNATLGFGLAAGAFWQLARGQITLGTKLVVGTGACFFAAVMYGWYMLLAIIIPTMELPFPNLPSVDLSTKIRAKSPRDSE